jgi:hypothetical protein
MNSVPYRGRHLSDSRRAQVRNSLFILKPRTSSYELIILYVFPPEKICGKLLVQYIFLPMVIRIQINTLISDSDGSYRVFLDNIEAVSA